jgi:RNA polymerase sigma factor for flagellar operon FliA
MSTPHTLADPRLRRLIEAQAPVVERIAQRMVRRLPANVQRDDLVQDGMLGLINALLRWTRATTGQHFENYVSQRARGARVDGLRAIDSGSRQRRKEMRQIEQAIQLLGHTLGRSPTEAEVARAMSMDIADYQRILQDVDGYVLISLDDLSGEENSDFYLEQCAVSHLDPLIVLERAAFRKTLIQAIEQLPEQKQLVLHLYYEEDLKMHQIGTALGLSEARVSQLHTQTIAQLRAALFVNEPQKSALKPRTRSR